MAIERCDKCGKAFLSQSEIDRHKMYEHPVPVLPLEEKGFDADLSKNNSNTDMEDLQKMTSNVTTGKTTANNNNNNNNNDITTFDSTQMRKVPFKTFKV
jgi:hypothetical protein